MSGWIKFEKNVASDPRFLRMVRAYRNADVTQERITERLAATQLLGCLLSLWMYADTHIRQDDTLDLGPDEIDEFIGLKGFAQLMPSDWLEVVDANRVKLPGFQEHNGTDAKKAALTQKRVARHRIRSVTQQSNAVIHSSNAGALPDQTRLDQTRPIKNLPSEGTVPQAGPAGQIDAVFEHWRTTHQHPQAKLDDKRRRLIAAALKLYPAAELCRAVSGYLASPHHMGQNDRGTRYDDIELMLRDAKHIDAGLKFHVEPPAEPESDYDRMMRLNGAGEDHGRRVFEHEPERLLPVAVA